jgi:hypothetical protein
LLYSLRGWQTGREVYPDMTNEARHRREAQVGQLKEPAFLRLFDFLIVCYILSSLGSSHRGSLAPSLPHLNSGSSLKTPTGCFLTLSPPPGIFFTLGPVRAGWVNKLRSHFIHNCITMKFVLKKRSLNE